MTLPWQLSIGEASERIQSGALTPSELVGSVLARIEDTDSALHPFVRVFEADARSEAAVADAEVAAGNCRGPLHGVPIAVKDIIDHGPTECGSQVLKGRVATRSAAAVGALRSAGAIVVGKTRTFEFAVGTETYEDPEPPPENPWEPGLSPGGSSSGSAVAVACGAAQGALGTDTGGSIRWPASACGIVGLQPTFDLVSREGVFPLAWSLDHIGPLARTVDDAAHLLDAMAPAWAVGPRVDAWSRDKRGRHRTRVAIPAALIEEECDPVTLRVFRLTIDRLAQLDIDVVEVKAPFAQGEAMAALWIVILAEAASVHNHFMNESFDLYGPELQHYLAAGRRVTAAQYLTAQRFRTIVRRWFRLTFEFADLVVMPTGGFRPEPIPASRRSPVTRTELPLYAVLSNLAVLPSIGLPCGFDGGGVPVGITLVAPPYREDRLISVGRQLEPSPRPVWSWDQEFITHS